MIFHRNIADSVIGGADSELSGPTRSSAGSAEGPGGWPSRPGGPADPRRPNTPARAGLSNRDSQTSINEYRLGGIRREQFTARHRNDSSWPAQPEGGGVWAASVCFLPRSRCSAAPPVNQLDRTLRSGCRTWPPLSLGSGLSCRCSDCHGDGRVHFI